MRSSRSRIAVGAVWLTALAAFPGCRRRALEPEPAPAAAQAAAPSGPARDSAYADDYRRTQIAYYRRAEWTYAGTRCALTDSRSGRTTPFYCGRIRVGTQPDANVTDLVRSVRGRTVALHPGEAPWRVIAVPAETEQAAILKLLADNRVRWAGLDFQSPSPSRRPARRSRG